MNWSVYDYEITWTFTHRITAFICTETLFVCLLLFFVGFFRGGGGGGGVVVFFNPGIKRLKPVSNKTFYGILTVLKRLYAIQ